MFSLLNQIQHIARNGLNYAQNVYDRERYDKLMALTAESYADLLDQPAEKIRELFLAEAGHITPKVGADAAIFNEEGEILLMERVDGSGCGQLTLSHEGLDLRYWPIDEMTNWHEVPPF